MYGYIEQFSHLYKLVFSLKAAYLREEVTLCLVPSYWQSGLLSVKTLVHCSISVQSPLSATLE